MPRPKSIRALLKGIPVTSDTPSTRAALPSSLHDPTSRRAAPEAKPLWQLLPQLAIPGCPFPPSRWCGDHIEVLPWKGKYAVLDHKDGFYWEFVPDHYGSEQECRREVCEFARERAHLHVDRGWRDGHGLPFLNAEAWARA